MRLSTHSQRLERWLGTETVEQLSRDARGWYGPPIPLGVPGLVYATGDGDFVGPIRGGHYLNAIDYVESRARSILRHFARRQMATAHTGFGSLSDLISEATAGKIQNIPFGKVSVGTGVVGKPASLWGAGQWPTAGGVGGASGTGAKCTKATTGALIQDNASGGDTLHLINIVCNATAAGTLALYDRLWDMTYNHATSTSTAIDSANRPDRYQGSTTAPGNFIGSDITTNLNITSHTVTVTYVDDAGNAAEAAAAYTQNVATAAGLFWNTSLSQTWFLPLNTPDRGVRYLTNIAQSTVTSTTGVQNFWVGHKLGWVPIPVANVGFFLDGINTALNLVRVYDDACLAMFEVNKPATAATRYDGLVTLCAG